MSEKLPAVTPTLEKTVSKSRYDNVITWSGLGITVKARFYRTFAGPEVRADMEMLRMACTDTILMLQGKKYKDPITLVKMVSERLERVVSLEITRQVDDGNGSTVYFE